MKRFSRVAVSAVVLSTTAVVLAPAARATPYGPVGALCELDAMSDPAPDADPDTMTGQISLGPALGHGTLWCNIHIDNPTHAGPTAPGGATWTRSEAPGIVAGAFQVFYTAPIDTQAYLCSEWRPAEGGVLYWDGVDGGWTPDSNTPCGSAIQMSTGPIVDAANDFVIDNVDPALCDLLDNQVGDYGAFAVTDEGDVYVDGGLFWDCPPYEMDAARAEGNGGGSGRDGRAQKNKQHNAAGPVGTTAPPWYPTGTITISSAVAGNVSVSYGTFDPARSTWTCEESGLVVTCVPPPPPTGYENRCGVLEVQVTNNGLGAVSGSSRCASGASAFATSFGPTTTPTIHSAGSYAPFPWTCEAGPSQPVPAPWTVRCTVGY